MKLLFLSDKEARDLAYYLSRSVFWVEGRCANIVAEEAMSGNQTAKAAMEARIDFLKIIGNKKQNDYF
uniref:Uncharacterized protein n=1 Tax=viral metagenome TaxID=1070528 RepID=A0A6H1ZXE4_9ZZZZ